MKTYKEEGIKKNLPVLVPSAGHGNFIYTAHFIHALIQTASQKIMRLKQRNVREKEKVINNKEKNMMVQR